MHIEKEEKNWREFPQIIWIAYISHSYKNASMGKNVQTESEKMDELDCSNGEHISNFKTCTTTESAVSST